MEVGEEMERVGSNAGNSSENENVRHWRVSHFPYRSNFGDTRTTGKVCAFERSLPIILLEA